MATNTAAYIDSPKARPFVIRAAPIGKPDANQVLVRNHAIAINPINGKLQSLAIYPLDYPTILGQDVAGEVVEAGPGVTDWKQGDRILGCAVGFKSKRDDAKAFQHYTILETNLASRIPDDMSFERAVVLPLSVATAASGLFNAEFLNLRLPTEPRRTSAGEIVLIWGGASSVGSSAIQLAVAAGYDVITTASPKNFDQVRKLGAKQVFDYNSATTVSDIIAACDGRTLSGAFDAVGGSAWAATTEIVQRCHGAKLVATAVQPFPEPPEGVTMKQMQALTVRDNHVGKAVFEDFLPKALQAGAFIPAPEPLVAGHGLESLQDAVDLQQKGTSARKVVVLL